MERPSHDLPSPRGATFFRENRAEQHPPCWNFKSKKVFDADWLKRRDSVTTLGNAAADTDFRANEAVGNAKDF